MAKKLRFCFSTMNSGKSSYLLMEAHSFEENNIPILCLKPSIDDRDGENIIKSRIGIQRDCFSIDITDNVFDLINEYCQRLSINGIPTPKWVLVDEAQFLTESQVDQLAKVVDDLDIDVMCFGLRTDFETHTFSGSKRLFEIADDIDEIKLSCSCGRKAIVNARLDENGNVSCNGEQILIGGNDRYKPMCRKCYNREIEKCKNNTNLM